MEVTYQQVLDGVHALRALSQPGYPLKVSATTRLVIARNLRRLKDALADFEVAVAGVKGKIKDGEKATEAQEAEFQGILKMHTTVLVTKLSLAALNLDAEAAIPEPVVDLLDWMVEVPADTK